MWLNQISIRDVSLVGGKNASLGEMINNLSKLNIRVPNGYVITAKGYEYFINNAGLTSIINQLLCDLTNDNKNTRKVSEDIKSLIETAEFPADMQDEILSKFQELQKDSANSSDPSEINSSEVAVRSSSTAEDMPDTIRCWTTGYLFRSPRITIVDRIRDVLLLCIMRGLLTIGGISDMH